MVSKEKVMALSLSLCCNTYSAAIMTYLVDKYHLPDHWYPKDLQKRAKVDEYLHWHHNYLRWIARSFFMRVRPSHKRILFVICIKGVLSYSCSLG